MTRYLVIVQETTTAHYVVETADAALAEWNALSGVVQPQTTPQTTERFVVAVGVMPE